MVGESKRFTSSPGNLSMDVSYPSLCNYIEFQSVVVFPCGVGGRVPVANGNCSCLQRETSRN